jgi:hypothetical protein
VVISDKLETVSHLYRCQVRAPWRHRFLIHLYGHFAETKTAVDIRCIIIKGIESSFLAGDTNDQDAQHSKDRCAAAHAPGEDSPDNSITRSRQAAQLRVETAYAHAPLKLSRDRHVLDAPRKNDCNHEPLNYWRGRRPCYPLSTEASATLEHNYTPVIKTSAVSSPKKQWSPRTTQQPLRQ